MRIARDIFCWAVFGQYLWMVFYYFLFFSYVFPVQFFREGVEFGEVFFVAHASPPVHPLVLYEQMYCVRCWRCWRCAEHPYLACHGSAWVVCCWCLHLCRAKQGVMLLVFCVCGCFCTRQRRNVFVTQGVMLIGLSTMQCMHLWRIWAKLGVTLLV